MRILFINDYATPTGGAEIVMLGLREELRSRGHEVRLLASTACPLGEASLADDHCFGQMSVLRSISQVWNPSARLVLKRILKEFQPDVVHVRLFLSQISPSILPLLRAVPTVFHAAWYKTICPLGTKLLPDGTACQNPAGIACVKHRCIPAAAYPTVMVQNRLLQQGFDAFNRVIANSHATRRKLTEFGIPVTGVIWNGVMDLGRRGPITRPPVVGFAGRLVPEKGTDLLIRAFSRVLARIPDARLLIAGEGPEMDKLKQLTAELQIGSSITFLGLLSQQELHREFATVWTQVIPSIWEEPFGLVAAESMMRATPVIASNSGGLSEFVEHGHTGLLCDPGDISTITNAIIELLSSAEENSKMGDCARQFALENLSFRHFADKWENIYTTMLTTTGT